MEENFHLTDDSQKVFKKALKDEPKPGSIRVLNDFHLWRTDKADYPQYTQKELTEAIDDILKSIKS